MKKRLLMIVSSLYLISSFSGCSYREFEDGVKEKLEEAQQESYQNEVEDMEISENAEGVLTIHAGEKNEVFSVDGIGSRVDFEIHDVKFYSSYSDFSSAADDVGIFMDEEQSGFLTMEIDVTNINYPGDSTDGTINMSLIGIAKKGIDDEEEMAVEMVYLEPCGEGDDYWHFDVKPGKTKTCTMGFLIDTKDASRLKEYVITPAGIMMEGAHEIPYTY